MARNPPQQDGKYQVVPRRAGGSGGPSGLETLEREDVQEKASIWAPIPQAH